MKKNIVYVLRRCIEGNIAYGGFEYPMKGIVEANDWSDAPANIIKPKGW